MRVLVRVPTPLRSGDQGRRRGASGRRHRGRRDRGSRAPVSPACATGSWWTRRASCGASSTSTSTRRTSASSRAPKTTLKAGDSVSIVPAIAGGPMQSVIAAEISEARPGLHRVGHPRDDAGQQPVRRHQPRPGHAELPAAAASWCEAAHRALDGDFHQYAITWGTPRLRRAIAEKYRRFYGMEVEPDRHVTVCCGSTETMLATLLAVLNPGDEVIIFEPFYENYGARLHHRRRRADLGAARAAATSRFDPDRLARAVTPRTRAIVFNSPNNPSGKVFSRAELQAIADLCLEHDLLAITDEIYEHIVYDGARPHADRDAARHGRAHGHDLGDLEVVLGDGLADRLRDRESRSCRWASAAPTTSSRWARRIPLQEAAVTALEFPDAYYTVPARERTRPAAICSSARWRRPASWRGSRGAPTTS